MLRRVAREPSWFQFAAWALFGASTALILLAAFTFGAVAIVPAAVFAGIALVAGGANVSAIGSAAGVGGWGFVLGWLNRDGPGNVCTSSGTGVSCTQEFAPWPSVLAGALVVGATVAAFAVLQRRWGHRRRPT